jgi:hypothetical protein
MASSRRLVGFVAMTLVALVVAHSLVFLLAYGSGYDEALAHSGHDGAWGTAVVVIIAAAIGLLGLGTWRLVGLGLLARRLPAGHVDLRSGLSGFGRRMAGLWLRLAGSTTVLFVIQENLERQHAGQALPGIGVLGSAEYPYAAFVIAAITLAVAFVVVLFRWRRDVLVARITAAGARWQEAPRTAGRRQSAWIEHRHASIVVHQVSGRAPPQLSST